MLDTATLQILQMEVFMRKIPSSVTGVQLTIEVSKEVHGPDYSQFNQAKLMNFHVFLHRIQRHRKRGGAFKTGCITFPDQSAARQFLAFCGGDFPPRPIVVDSANGRSRHVIQFMPSKKDPRPQVLETIKNTPFVDAQLLHERDDIKRNLESGVIALRGLQFGRECRDGVFSIEWEKVFDMQDCMVSIEYERRLILISHGYYGVRLSFSQVHHAQYNDSSEDSSVLLSLKYPPIFTDKPSVFGLNVFGLDLKAQRTALPFVPGASNLSTGISVQPFTSLRLLCASKKDLRQLQKSWSVARVRRAMSAANFPAEPRNLYSTDALKQIEQWLNSLDWCVAFHADALVKNEVLEPREILSIIPHIGRVIAVQGAAFAAGLLRFLGLEWARPTVSDDTEGFQTIEEYFPNLLKEYRDGPIPAVRERDSDGVLFDCYHATVTPTRILLEGPFPEQTNRVIRQYYANCDSFIRIAFVDENNLHFHHDEDIDHDSFIQTHVGRILGTGLRIGGRWFEFLAYSQSALKQHSLWFVTRFQEESSSSTVTCAADIIERIGDFRDNDTRYCPARYGARISQAFTATIPSIPIDTDGIKVKTVDDITRGKHCFTDGIGTISPGVANEVWKVLCHRKRFVHDAERAVPKALQIRLGGAKGILSVDHRLPGKIIQLRPSMIKFNTPGPDNLEIARICNKPNGMTLNRPLIMILEGLGINGDTFVQFQRDAIKRIESLVSSTGGFAQVIGDYGLGTSFRLTKSLLRVSDLGCDIRNEFYRKLVKTAVLHILRDIKHHARIPVPGYTLVGVADIHGYLKEGEIFACIDDGVDRKFLKGPVCVSRSPTIHPGDVQMAHAIGSPPADSPFAIEPLANTVVFSTQGNWTYLLVFGLYLLFSSQP